MDSQMISYNKICYKASPNSSDLIILYIKFQFLINTKDFEQNALVEAKFSTQNNKWNHIEANFVC